MSITKEKKNEILSELAKTVAGSKSVVFVNFHGLTVADSSKVRRALRDENVGYSVARKTLVNRVLDAAGFAGDKPNFPGELALAFGEDLIAPARGVYEFQKKLDNKINIVGGIFEGKYMSAVEMTAIAAIPSMDALRGMFVNIINSPIQRFVIGLSEIAKTKN